MDYQKILKIAETKLNLKFENVIQDIKDCIASVQLGGEIIDIVGRYLIDLKTTNGEAYFILKDDIEEYLIECKKNGRIIL